MWISVRGCLVIVVYQWRIFVCNRQHQFETRRVSYVERERFVCTLFFPILVPSKYWSLLTIPSTLYQVCELDIIFNFEKAYYMLDELLIAGEIQETSKKNVLKAIAAQDMLQEVLSMSMLILISVSMYVSVCDVTKDGRVFRRWSLGINIPVRVRLLDGLQITVNHSDTHGLWLALCKKLFHHNIVSSRDFFK